MIEKIKMLSLKSRLFILIAMSTTAIIAFFLIIITLILQNYIVQQTVETTENKVQIVNQSLEEFCSSTEGYIRVMAADIRLQEGLLKYEDTRKANQGIATVEFSMVASKTCSVVALADQVVGAAVFSKDQTLLYKSTRLNSENVSSVVSKEMLEEAENRQKPVWDKDLARLHTTMPEETVNVLPLYKVVRHVDSGKVLGYMVLFVSEEGFREIANLSDVFETSSFFIIDQEKQILSSNQIDLIGTTIAKEYEWVLNEEESFLKWGKPPSLYITSHREYNRWKVLYIVPMKEIVVQRKALWSTSTAAIIGILVGIYFCVWAISSKITKPIADLTSTMRAIEESADMNIRVEGNFQGEMEVLSNGFNNLITKLQALMKQIYQEQRMKRKLELQLLQSQVNPHFLYNTLETISSLLMLKMNSEAQMVCDSLSEFYKLSLSKGNDMISLRDEFRLLKDYLKIQSIRYVEYMEYYVECDESIYDVMVPKLLIQPIVENAIYHGIKQQKGKGMILVNGYQNEESNRVIIEVIDTGNGIEKKKLSELREIIHKGTAGEKSFGLGSVAARLRTVYGDDGKLIIDSTPGISTNVRIEITKRDDRKGADEIEDITAG